MKQTTEPIFTPEQCNIISKLGRAMPPQNAQVGGGQGGKYDTKTRISHISWIPFDQPDSIPMYKKLEDVMHKTNRRHFGFQDMAINEQAQYTEYPEGGFYDWGGLELAKPGNILRPKQGHAIFFASFINHRVVPITKGLRKSLVMWFGGEPFK